MQEVQACVAACADWLEHNGFCLEAAEPPPPVPRADDIIYRLKPDAGDIGQPGAGAVKTILIWLHWTVLPGIDGRRHDDRGLREANASGPALPNAQEHASLHFGDDEERLAKRVRAIVSSQAALEKQVASVHRRRMQRAPMLKQARPGEVIDRYRSWVAEGEALVNALLSATSTPRRIPRTTREWGQTRALLEIDLKAAGFTTSQVLSLLPQGGEPKDVRRRTARARERAAR